MSRHQALKHLDLDEELDDFDGGEDYEYDAQGSAWDELSEEDQENMKAGTIAIRAELSPQASTITDKQIQEALWHYYYDIEKSVAYLESTYAPKAKPEKKSKPKEVAQKGGKEMSMVSADFFRDTPWLNVPQERVAVFIPPPVLPGGLLGGAENIPPKMSKLQALAAARKKKAQDAKSTATGTGLESPLAKLNIAESEPTSTTPSNQGKTASRTFATRKRKDDNPHEKAEKPSHDRASEVPLPPTMDPDIDMEPLDQAEPSAFASTMFSNTSSVTSRRPDNIFSLPYSAIATTSFNPFAGPSPDDVVIAAQSKASGKQWKGPPKTKNEKKVDQIANGVESIKIDATPKAVSKNLDVMAEYNKAKAKNAANFVVIGHVDAGKSTLMGRLLYDLGVVDQRTIDRYRKEAENMGKASFALAWVLDQGSEERSRGVTIDIAMNKFETSKTSFTILDAPGHRDFIPNMIAGAAQADFAVLVVDASTGSFESGLKGQTKEHALLVRSMGVQRIIIAVNKLDTVNWSEERFEEIKNQISAFLTTAGFQAKNIAFIPCSGLFGDNIARRSTEAAASWYAGPTLIDELDNSEPITRALDKPLRLTIGDIFRGGVQNPLSISGRIEAGGLQTGDALLVQPASQKCFIKGIEKDQETVDWAVAGQNVTIHLSGIEEQYLRIGDVLSSPTSPIQNVTQFTAKVLTFEFLTPMQVDVHRGRLHAAGRIKEIVAVLDKGTGNPVGKKKPRIVKPGMVARVVVELDVQQGVPLEAPSRVVLRSNGETVAAGLLE